MSGAQNPTDPQEIPWCGSEDSDAGICWCGWGVDDIDTPCAKYGRSKVSGRSEAKAHGNKASGDQDDAHQQQGQARQVTDGNSDPLAS